MNNKTDKPDEKKKIYPDLQTDLLLLEPPPPYPPILAPQALTALIESLVFSHQPTWDDCQQLLQTLLTTEERQRVLLEARKNVPGNDERPTLLPNEIDTGFPLTRPPWDFNMPDGREHLRVYRQALGRVSEGQRNAPPIWLR